MSNVTTIQNGILTRLATHLGSTWSTLDYIIDLSQNKFRRQEKRYGVRALGSSQVEGRIHAITQDQVFEVILVHSYATTQKDDSDKVTKTLLLQDAVQTLYNDLVSNLCGADGVVIHTFDLSIDEPDYLDTEKVVILRFSFTVKHHNVLT